jgi:hypothetical protein
MKILESSPSISTNVHYVFTSVLPGSGGDLTSLKAGHASAPESPAGQYVSDHLKT